MTKTYRIAAIPGDGIGKEVLPVGQRVIDRMAVKHGFLIEWTEFDWSCERYHQTGRMMPEDGIEQIKAFDSIYLGAVGFPGVPDHISLWGLLIPLRRELDQYANVRPVRLLKGITSPLAGRGPEDIDMIVVRENVEGEYSEIGGRVYQGTEHEAAVQQSILTRRGTDRIMDYAFKLAKTRKRGHVASATKSNGIIHTMPFWDERFAAAADQHPGIDTAQFHIDIMTAHFVLHPDWFDVVVASNLFGDILSDLGPAVAGSIGIAPSAKINPEGTYPSMFEPVHGSAPDIAGKGVANPVAAVWTAAMMLEHLGEAEAAAEIERAIEVSLETPDTKTRDLGGTADTKGSEDAILNALT
ncbi:tartrate dehydrogenase [Phaeobacter sp. 11ANDIMAR09]|uniref:tartrate dehydrogenase n=1 Tax=Phaeobacter sp. 11ANDIMAR09 TaxID=1225647 RepID=UPI0006C8D50D|nr:tartrate dehydrogenase [Phaeobacter sp. 11ANDIMAR09]KPD10699.1 tartrate dehydrogenase [Phaeobacter sp. 11ANDIMAR09]